MSMTMNATDNPHVKAVIARRAAGEPSVRGYHCNEGCGWLAKRVLGDRCPQCYGRAYMVWGYWGTCDESAGNDAWFYPLSEIRAAAAAEQAGRIRALLSESEYLRSL